MFAKDSIPFKASAVCSSIWLVLVLATLAWSGEFFAFGPEAFVRATATPVTVVRYFSVVDPSADYVLRIEADSVASAVLMLNDETVVGPKNFNQKVSCLELPVVLEADNVLVLKMQAKPGGGLTLSVVGVDEEAPEIQIIEPADGSELTEASPSIRITYSGGLSGIDPTTFHAEINGVDSTSLFTVTQTEATYQPTTDLPGGDNVITASIRDQAGNSASATSSFQITLGVLQAIPGAQPTAGRVPLTVSFTTNGEDPSGTIEVFQWDFEGDGSWDTYDTMAKDYTHTYDQPGSYTATLYVQSSTGATATAGITISVELPPDPATVAPPLDLTVATTMHAATAFLYTGEDPIQTGVAPETIEPRRAAVLRGKALTRDGNPLPGVTITILGHPEYGQTLSRADGMFDMVVNGGGVLTVDYAKPDYLPSQRQIDVPWQDYVWLPEVVMIPLDTNAALIDLGASVPIQVARGSVVTDDDGTRQATLLFPQGTTCEMVLPDGSSQSLTSLTVRATEYTVGENGPLAMPAELPPTSGYTYCVELSADEAMAAGATEVQFSEPVPFYLENFLNFTVGGVVPVGSYDRRRGQWIASENGQVIAILSITNGLADLDLTGDGVAGTSEDYAALGVTDAERQQIAALYTSGVTLWRIPVSHVTPWDCNWPVRPPDDAEVPKEPPPRREDRKEEEDCEGCDIAVRNQVLSEGLPIAGTCYTLNYSSDRVPGRLADYRLHIPLSGWSVPASLKRIDLEIHIAGRTFRSSFAPLPDQSTTFTWDGKDAYGRALQGAQPVTVHLGHVYDGIYVEPQDFSFRSVFGRFYGAGTYVTGGRTREEIVLWRKVSETLGNLNVRELGLGGWTLDVHHVYDPIDKVLYLGEGGRRSAKDNRMIEVYAAPGAGGYDGDGRPLLVEKVEVGPDGRVYLTSHGNAPGLLYGYGLVRVVDSDGSITTIAGNGTEEYSGDGVLATQTGMYVSDIALGPDGSLYIADISNRRVYRVDADGIINTVVGTGDRGACSHPCYDYDPATGGWTGSPHCPAMDAHLRYPHVIAVGPDGTLYMGNADSGSLYEVGTDGLLSVVVGCPGSPYSDEMPYTCFSDSGYSGDGGPASKARIKVLDGISAGRDGSVYVADGRNRRVRKISPDGIINTVAGTGDYGYNGDGRPATEADLRLNEVTVGPNGILYIPEFTRIRIVNTQGIIGTLAGNGDYGMGQWQGVGGPATAADVGNPQDVAIGPDESVYIPYLSGVLRVRAPLPGYSNEEITIASKSGTELYRFDATGRHLRTINTLTGAVIHAFTYDADGRLTGTTDLHGDVTTVERDAEGNPLAIVSPYGHRTNLSLNANGYLEAIGNPADEIHYFVYTDDGLLTRVTKPAGNTYTYAYDDLGRVIREDDPAGGFQNLTRSPITDGYEVTLETAEGKQNTYSVEHLSTGEKRFVNSTTCCGGSEVLFDTRGTRTATYPYGTVEVAAISGPDPRFGMQAPYVESQTIDTPGGLSRVLTRERSATLSDPDDPLSLATFPETTDINGRVFSRAFDASQNRITETTPQGRQRFVTLDAQGRITASQVANLTPVGFSYDLRGRLSSITQGTRSYTMSYNGSGDLIAITDSLSRVTGYSYDAVGRLVGLTPPGGSQTTCTYDANGNVKSVTPPGQPAHTFDYTAVDLRSQYTPPAVGAGTTATNATYNLDRELTQTTLPDGRSLAFSYDQSGRLATLTVPRGAISFSHQPESNRLASIQTPEGDTLGFNYDGHLLTALTWSGSIAGNVDRSYDNNFRVISERVDGASEAAFQYDADGLLTGAGALAIQRDAQHGLITGTSLGDVQTASAYGSFGETESYDARYQGSSVLSISCTRDASGRIIQETETVLGVTKVYGYSYDTSGHLIRVTLGGVNISTYDYDGNGNRVNHTSSSETLEATYDAQDRLTSYGTNTYSYNASGDRVSKTDTATSETTSYVYDVFGNLLSASLADGTVITYVVDGQNRRIGKKVNGVLVQGFLYRDQLNPIAELDGAGNVVSRFVYGSKTHIPDYVMRGASTYRILSDYLGSPRLVIDVATGMAVQVMSYDAFGNVTADTDPGFQPFGFAGGLYDPHTKLIRFGARDYDAETGRFTTKDPRSISLTNTNLYTYALGDPVNRVDTTGLASTWGSLIAEINLRLETQRIVDKSGGSSPIFDVLTMEEIAEMYADELRKHAKKNANCALRAQSIVDSIGGGVDLVTTWEEIEEEFGLDDWEKCANEKGCESKMFECVQKRVDERKKNRRKEEEACKEIFPFP